ncbi:MAG: TonB-dependent receptor [Rudaea sp.]|nr:TonB-dependent receptor [Rudaea sp.]
MCRRSLPALSFVFFFCAHAWADAGADQTSLPPVVVTATRTAQSPFEVPASIDAVYLDDPGTNTPGINASEYLAGIPGLLARDRENYAQDEQISIRGFGARSTFGVRGVRLYTDGIPATMPDGQGQVSNFSLDSADRIEVLRGPFSALYGNSSGGVIQIFTADGADPPELRAGLDGGGYGTYKLDLNARGLNGALGYNVDLSQFYTDGYRGHSRAERENGNAKFDIHLDGERKLTLILNTVALPNADDPLGLTSAQLAADPRQSQPVAVQFDTRKSVHQAEGGAIYEQTLDADQSIRIMSYFGQRDVQQFQAIPVSTQLKPTSPGGVIDLDGDYGGGDARWTWHGVLGGRPLDLSAGVSYDRQDQHRLGYNNYVGTVLGVQGALRRDEQDDEYDFDQYVQATWNFAERWLLIAGARHSNVDFTSDDSFITTGNPNDSGQTSYSATTPVAGLLYRASATWHLYASYGSGFETPTFNELGYRPDGSAGINFDLVPARSRNGEIGSKWVGGNGAGFNIALFQSDTRHELAIDTSTGGRTTYQNIDRAQRKGVEARVVYPLAERWRIQSAYTYLDARFLSPFLTCPAASTCTTPNTLVAAGARIPGVPRQDFYTGLHYGARLGWNASLEANVASDTPVNDLNTQAAAGYAVVNSSVGYTFEVADATISTFFRLNNVFDRSYVGSVIVNESNGRYFEPAPGRNVFAGVRIDWKH